MSHNPYTRPTKFDVFTSFACVGFFTLAVGMGFNPVGRLESRRDDEREHGVRAIYASLVQMETEEPEVYAEIMSQVEQAGDQRVLIGDAVDCAGYWGRQCGNSYTFDSCASLQKVVDEGFLQAVPIAPGDAFSQQVTGYYLQIIDEQLQVGACDPSEGAILLPAS